MRRAGADKGLTWWVNDWMVGENLLGYRDVVNTEHTGLAGGPIQIAAKPDYSQLTDDELKQLRTIAEKTLPPGRD
jgi:hypothetical protein